MLSGRNALWRTRFRPEKYPGKYPASLTGSERISHFYSPSIAWPPLTSQKADRSFANSTGQMKCYLQTTIREIARLRTALLEYGALEAACGWQSIYPF